MKLLLQYSSCCLKKDFILAWSTFQINYTALYSNLYSLSFTENFPSLALLFLLLNPETVSLAKA